jgi:phosphoribosylformylglycinamidine synthase
MVAECCRNLSTAGALPVAATNNLNFGNPERPEIMAQLVESIEGMAEACAFFETPITGGNVSLYNETLGQGVFPSPVLGIVGLVTTSAPVTVPFKHEGREIILLGGFGRPDVAQMGGTQFAKQVLGKMFGVPPALDMAYEKNVQGAIRDIVKAGLVESAHDLSDGGLGVALAECTFGGTGADIEIDYPIDSDLLLFHEGPSRILVSTMHADEVKKIALFWGVESPRIGVTMKDRLRIRNGSITLLDCAIGTLRDTWDSGLVNLLHPEQHPHV